ncbi:hypothetical protein NLI96_g6759 [Meripilus lineatus]|uniref:Uncharacterized protein n=1 Tax=Meripilus lineatus TaxID=2056292 RepID=A0AAD5YFL8_9APHY|nr:hypothetical protein NLI96_g6759 [Physisporinus lineatus]
MATPVKEYSLNVLATPDTQRARPTVLVCVPVHHGPYDLVVRVRTGRYDSRDHRVRSRDLPSAVHDPPPASEWSEDGRTITMYPFKAWDGPVVVEEHIAAAASRQALAQRGGDGSLESDVATRGGNEMGEVGGVKMKDEGAEKDTASSLPSDDVDMVPGTPGQDDEAEEEMMMRSYRRNKARMEMEVMLT